jgi:protein SCO1/2
MKPIPKSAASLLLSVAAAVCGAHEHQHHGAPAEQLARSTTTYQLDGLALLRADGKEVALAEELDHDGPLVLDFVFTTCTTICPILSHTFAMLQAEGNPAGPLRLVSISIDPQHDTPAVLRAYARQFDAGAEWRFYTGTVAQSVAVQRAFGVYRGNKMNHVPLTFVRRARGEPWVRLEGYASAADIARELAH